MTTRVQLRRIKILIEELEKLPTDGVFKMDTWCELSGGFGTSLKSKIRKAVRNPCGTAACLAGKAGLIPRIRRMGFKWDVLGRWGHHANFRYKTFIGGSARWEFFGEDVNDAVFTSIDTIDTLPEGIEALKEFVKDAELGYYDE